MKASLIIAILALWLSPGAAQTPSTETMPADLSVRDQIKAARAKEKAEESSDHSKRPWDRDSNGKRPWEVEAQGMKIDPKP